MKRQPARMKTVVTVLTDPDPNYVSMVDHGAIQRPFHVVKHHAKQEAEGMPKQPEFKIHRVVFDSEHFATKQAVSDYLTSKGYSDFTVSKDDEGGFYVEDTPADQFPDGTLRTVPHSSTKGITYIAGEASVPEGEPAEGTAASKGESTTSEQVEGEAPEGTDANAGGEAAAKAEGPDGSDDSAGADKGQDATARKQEAPKPRVRIRRGLAVKDKSLASVVAGHEVLQAEVETKGVNTAKSFADMLSNYNGPVPPGVYDMADALMGSIRKMFSDGDVDETKVNKLASDFAGGVMALYDVYSNILANKSDASDDGMAEALLAFLFDTMAEPETPAEKAAGGAAVAALAEQLSVMQTKMDQMAVALVERDHAAAGEAPGAGSDTPDAGAAGDDAKKSDHKPRTVKGRNSTDTDESALAAQKADEAAIKEAEKRTVARTFGRHAADRL